MSVLIKGMKMPENCSLCPFCFGANNICPWTREYANSKGRHKDCPLVPVPPHGRLIDADELRQKWKALKDGRWYKVIEVEDLDNAPTVIPADKEIE